MDSVEEVRILAALAGIRLSDEPEADLTAGFEGMRRIAEALRRRDYGEAGPACWFRPPRRADQ